MFWFGICKLNAKRKVVNFMNEKNVLNTNLDPEVEKIRDQIISKIGDKPLDEVNQIIKKLPFIPCNEKILASQQLHLNHYAIRSLDWFKRVKMTRGSAASQGSANVKSRISYFKEFDKCSNDIYDLELKKKNL